MKDLSMKFINGIDLIPYQTHPRVVELRVVMIYELLGNEYSEEFVVAFLRSWCEINSINWTFISALITQAPRVRRLKVIDKERYKQEIVFMGQLFNENRGYVAERYLNVSKRWVYSSINNMNIKDFLTNDWLNELSSNVVICGVKQYLNAGVRLLETLDNLLEVLGHVSVAKKRL